MKKLLKEANGVYSINIDGEVGKVTVKRTINPDQLAAIIGKATCENNNKKPPVATCNDQSQFFKGYEVTELQELAKTKKLKQLEVTLTRNLRMNFSEEKDDEASQNGFGSDKKETPSSSDPKKIDEKDHHPEGTNPTPHDQSKGDVGGCTYTTTPCGVGGPSNCADHEMRNSHHCGGHCCYTPHPCYHVPPPCHAYHYPPPVYQNYTVPPPKDNASNCIIQ
ncbi:Heavy metal-associated domain, HMA [Sesbania bispinosa]|nr:Heavy metal-associated domain, HMA [Sesbania bispinosa]